MLELDDDSNNCDAGPKKVDSYLVFTMSFSYLIAIQTTNNRKYDSSFFYIIPSFFIVIILFEHRSRVVICGEEDNRKKSSFRGKWRHKYEHVSIYKSECTEELYWHDIINNSKSPCEKLFFCVL